MVNITCAVNTLNENILQDFKKKMAASRIHVTDIPQQANSRYVYFRLEWDNDLPRQKAGAKPKKLFFKGKEADCSLIWKFRMEGLSDAEIAAVLDIGESTVRRRRKKHLEDGDFYEGSTII